MNLTSTELQLLIELLHDRCTYHLNMVVQGELTCNDIMQAYHENEFEKVSELLRKVEG